MEDIIDHGHYQFGNNVKNWNFQLWKYQKLNNSNFENVKKMLEIGNSSFENCNNWIFPHFENGKNWNFELVSDRIVTI